MSFVNQHDLAPVTRISTVCEKFRNTEFFLVRIFLCSVRIQEDTDQKKLHIWTLFMQWRLMH